MGIRTRPQQLLLRTGWKFDNSKLRLLGSNVLGGRRGSPGFVALRRDRF